MMQNYSKCVNITLSTYFKLLSIKKQLSSVMEFSGIYRLVTSVRNSTSNLIHFYEIRLNDRFEIIKENYLFIKKKDRQIFTMV